MDSETEAQAIRCGMKVRLWRPGHAEHGASGVATEVAADRAYCALGWRCGLVLLDGVFQAVTEAEYQRARAALAHPWVWRA